MATARSPVARTICPACRARRRVSQSAASVTPAFRLSKASLSLGGSSMVGYLLLILLLFPVTITPPLVMEQLQ